ncbi:MAG: hypothetical protein AAF532_09795 [Planctomycetota bacterium]
MSPQLTVGLTAEQREILLTGLRYVRSSISLEMSPPSPEVESRRREKVKSVEDLVDQLAAAEAVAPAGV